jgi:hypothetical protein
MELKDQVCTTEQGKILKELGVRQDTAFSWLSNYDFPVLNGKESPHFVCAAYTVAEMGVMMSYNSLLLCESERNEDEQWVGSILQYEPTTENIGEKGWEGVETFKGINEADVRAQILIYALDYEGMNAADMNKALGDCII